MKAGSGGALGLAVADEVWMLENSVYSVISPEGCASILWKDPAKTWEAAECLKMTADDLLKLNVIERIIKEDKDDFSNVYSILKTDLYTSFIKYLSMSTHKLTQTRYMRFRKIGGGEK